jgi:hypothetical protein
VVIRRSICDANNSGHCGFVLLTKDECDDQSNVYESLGQKHFTHNIEWKTINYVSRIINY